MFQCHGITRNAQGSEVGTQTSGRPFSAITVYIGKIVSHKCTNLSSTN